jgi:two-component system, cell cycle response regulator DivK
MAAKRVLHIEDNPSNRKAVQHIFRMTDYQLLEAADGEEGIELALRETPDLILLDIQLPGLSGYDVARRLREDERTLHTPIVAITSYALSGDDRKAQEAGCDDYIAKPYRPQILLDMLKKHLNS